MAKASAISTSKALSGSAFPPQILTWWDETTRGITPSNTVYFRKFWPEVELNSTFFQNGKNDGLKQNFVTPGLVMRRFHLWGRVGFTVGGGYQIATTRFHTTNHNAILSIRFPF